MLEKHIFKHKDGGICEVYTPKAIERLRNNKDYSEVKPKAKEVVKEEVKDDKKIEANEK